MRQSLIILSILFSINLVAQDNIFTDRSFWKSNPSIAIVDEKIAEGNDITELNSNAFDGVVYALLEKIDNETVKYLLSKKGNDVNKITHDGRTYMFWAAYADNLEMVKYLFENGAKTDIIDSHGSTVLNFVANSGLKNTELYDYIFSIGADVEMKTNYNGANALLLISPHLEDFQLVDYFINKGATFTDKDNNGNGIFEYAAKGGNINFLKMLTSKNATIGNNAMIFATQGARRNKTNLETYKALEKMGAKVNVVDENNTNPLHSIANYSDDIATFQYFLSKDVDVNHKNNDGRTPFMYAANRNNLEVVTYLFPKVDDINTKDNNGLSALSYAVNRNSINVVNFLLENGADINIKDEKGNSLSYYLINNFNEKNPNTFEEKLKLLQNKGLTINTLQANGNSLLHLATERNDLALLKRLKDFNIDVNIKNQEGLTALQIAAMKSKDIEIIKYLLEIGADKNVKTDFEETVYDLASENELLQQQNINFLK